MLTTLLNNFVINEAVFNPLTGKKLVDHLKHLLIDPSIHLCNMILSPVIGIVSPAANDSYHQASGLIARMPTNIEEFENFLEVHDEISVEALLPLSNVIQFVKSEIPLFSSTEQEPQPFAQSPLTLSYLHKKNLCFLKERLLIDIYKTYLLILTTNMSTQTQLSERTMSELTGYTFIQLNHQFDPVNSLNPYLTEILCTDYPQDMQLLQTKGRSVIENEDLSTAEKVDLIVKPAGLVLIPELIDYLKTMRKIKPEELINGFKKLKRRYPGIQTELKKLEESLTHPLFPAIDNDRFSDLLIYTEN